MNRSNKTQVKMNLKGNSSNRNVMYKTSVKATMDDYSWGDYCAVRKMERK